MNNTEMPDEIYVQLGENRIGTEICLRKWSEKPFEDGTKYARADKAAPVERIEGLAEGLRVIDRPTDVWNNTWLPVIKAARAYLKLQGGE